MTRCRAACGVVARAAPSLARVLAALAGVTAPHLGSAADATTHLYPQGATAFQANCALCHGPSGAGVPSLAPPLLSYPPRYASSAEGRRQLAMTVLYGMFGDITVGGAHFNSQMPAFAQLDDATLAAVLNYVVFDLGRASTAVKPLAPGEIAAERARPLDGAAVREHRKSVAAPGV
jgi:mono/diheme cytochrome c family protein